MVSVGATRLFAGSVDVEVADEVRTSPELTADLLRRAKRHGFSDAQIAALRNMREDVVRGVRWALGVRPVFKTVDTCAAEFAARTPYHYSTYDSETEVRPRQRPAVLILGSGPNRIGQGIEFDYSCVHASMALAAAPDNDGAGYETIMVNCNPETVSTDYDTSDRLYFEPLTCEDVLEVVHAETAAGPVAGVVVQLGGQTPLRLAQPLKDAGVPIVGTPPEAIHLAEDRGAFGEVLAEEGLPAPKHGMARSFDEAKRIADEIGYPVLVRPSYVLGGRGMEIVYDEPALSGYIERATEVSPTHPVLVDRFLDDAVEIDVDALYDGADLYLGGVMEHIEEAGIHSGDSACALPPITLGAEVVDRIRVSTEAIARGVGVRGLLNIQFALAGDTLYVLEANPRASRTVPFVSKATATALAKAAARIDARHLDRPAAGRGDAAGHRGRFRRGQPSPIAVKEAVMPFNRFRTVEGVSVDTILGPEMKSTGEVMGLDDRFGVAFAKSQVAGFGPLPTKGTVFISVANRDKRHVIFPVKRLADLGFEILATAGTASMLRRHGVQVTTVRKHSQGPGPDGRADDRAGDPGQRGRPDLQHPARAQSRRAAALRRVRDPDRGGAAQRPVHHHRPGPGRGRAGHRGDPGRRRRRPVAAVLDPGRPGCVWHRPWGSGRPDPERTWSGAARCSVRLPAVTPSGCTSRPWPRSSGSGESPPALRARRRAGAAAPDAGDRGRDRLPGSGRGGRRDGQERGRGQGLGRSGVRPRRAGHGDGASRSPATTGRGCSGCRQSRAIVNRMGFNNLGAAALADRLARGRRRPGQPAVGMPVGISIGKTKTTPLAEATEDYLTSLRLARPVRRLRRGQRVQPQHPRAALPAGPGRLHELIGALVAEALALAGRTGTRCRSSSRWPPTSTEPRWTRCWTSALDAGADRADRHQHHPGPRRPAPVDQDPGRRGRRSVRGAARPSGPGRWSRYLAARSDLPVIGVGGIMTADDAQAMLDAGARLVQLYTGYIYARPALVAALNRLAPRPAAPR